ncbi:MAG: PAS domain S-box protein, partial [Bacteroidota bacterium]|nr:PAS domain S-box protein [Bacteroidota bacterium]MDX5429464.1 PAS domain S-box protein [Bacteroidota bacterium]MDX5468256.1 PAS domain S-box protein [Bacteroidota bacterium]
LEELGDTSIQSWLRFVHPADNEISDLALKEHFEGRSEFYVCEVRMRHKNGNWIWVLDKGKVVSWDKEGNPEWMAGSHQDITEIKHREEMLARFQELLQKSNEAAKIGTWEVDLETLHIHWDAVSREVFKAQISKNYNVKEAIEFFKEGESRSLFTDVFNQAVEQGQAFDKEFQIVNEEGQTRWIRAIGVPEMSGKECKRVYGLFQDIDEKNRLHHELMLQEKQFRQTFENAPNGIALVGLNGQWLKVNKSLCDMLGYTSEELMNITFGDITHPDDLSEDWQFVEELLAGKRENYQMEKRYFHKNGSTVWALLAVSLIKNEKGEPLHFISQINDITEVKKSHLEIHSLLEVSKEQNARLLNFAHIVSHNLRSHVGNFVMLLDLLKIEKPECTENDFFPLLTSSAGSLQETIEYLNEIVAISESNQDKMEALPIHQFVEKALNDLSLLIMENTIQVKVEVPKELKIMAIPAYLDSVILNLLSNAIKYRSTERSAYIEIQARENINGRIELTIQDNGLGIDLNLNGQKLFGMYKTFHGNKDAKGMGLFLTKNQIEAMGGQITVESEVNHGTTFKVYFKNAEN